MEFLLYGTIHFLIALFLLIVLNKMFLDGKHETKTFKTLLYIFIFVCPIILFKR